MQLSATRLGQKFGLNGQEMNRILEKRGYLSGEPGNYDLTSKGIPYAMTKNFHKGSGGYACYNRYWATRTFDDSIMAELEVTKELIAEVRAEIEKDRGLKVVALNAARAKADAEFLAKQAAKKAAEFAKDQEAQEALKRMDNWKKIGKIGLITSGMVIVGYGTYKTVPKIKRWWHERKEPEDTLKESD